VSDPTYRIDTEHKPGESLSVRWVARIFDLGDDERYVNSFHHSTEEGAIRQASEWLAAQNAKQSGRSLFVDDDGQPVEAHSVKA
jgi:hypothetical protein